MAGELTPQKRAEALAAMGDPAGLDILVVGGGITGVGIALDAATRGLKVGIVEAQDWSSGTSSRSSKLVHGGLRYLQMLDFRLVHEALTERDLLLTELAPHLVKPVSFLFPLEHRVWQRAYVGAGVALYDVLASFAGRKRALPIHRHHTRGGIKRLIPDVKSEAAVGAVRYWDAAVDDSRLVLTVLRTAVAHGAHAASRTQVLELTREGERVTGAVLEDLETGKQINVRAKQVISATGVWTEQTEALSGRGSLRVLASKGIHIVVPRERIKGTTGLILQTEKSVLFIIPWSRYWVIGTTDTPWTESLQHPAVTAADIDYVLAKANAVLERPLTRDDIIGTWAGLRPLLQPGTKKGTSSAKVSREHTTASPTPGLTTIAGGKLTTYRVMAKDAVDFAIGDRATAVPCVTHKTPLLGAVGLSATRNRARIWSQQYGWDSRMMEHLLHRYGSMLQDLVDAIQRQPDLARPLKFAPAYLRAEIAYAASHEGALHLDDIMMHRTRLNYEIADRGIAALEEIADIVAPMLGWDKQRRQAEIEEYQRRIAAERAAEDEADDAAADRVRTSAQGMLNMRELSNV